MKTIPRSLLRVRIHCLKAIDTHLEKGVNRQMIVLPTGAGKTFVFSELIRRKHLKTLVIAHRIELLQQAKEKLARVAPDISAGIFCGNEKDLGHQVTIASIQSTAKVLDLLEKEDCQLLIIDEAHHSVAQTYRQLIESLGFMTSSSKKLLVGFTATPKREDKISLKDVFQEVTYSLSIRQLVNGKFLVKPEGLHVKVGIDLKKVRSERGDFKKSSLRKVMLSDQARGVVVKTVQQYASNRRGIVFSVDIDHSEMLKDDLKEGGFSCDVVHSRISLEERKSRLKAFADGDLQFIVNPMILTEGFDCPEADCMVNVAPTKNRSLYIQKAGRVLRNSPRKENALLIDFGTTKKKQTLMTAMDLMGEEIVMKTVTDRKELYHESAKEKSIHVDLEVDEVSYNPLNGRPDKPILCDHGLLNPFTWPVESVKATIKQKDFILKLCSSIGIKVAYMDQLGIGRAKKIIGHLLEKKKLIQEKTPITQKQAWCLKKLAREKRISGLNEDKIHRLSKYEARELIGSLMKKAG